MANPYFTQQLAQAHCQALLQEAQHEQLLAQLPSPNHNLVHYTPTRLTSFLRAIGARLKQLGQARKQTVFD